MDGHISLLPPPFIHILSMDHILSHADHVITTATVPLSTFCSNNPGYKGELEHSHFSDSKDKETISY